MNILIHKYYFAYILLIICPLVFAQDTEFEDFLRSQQEGFEDFVDEFRNYEEQVTKEYETYVKEQQQLFETFKKEVEKKWDEFRFSSREEYVDYDEDLNSRASVNFKEGEVEIEVIVESDIPNKKSIAEKRLQEKIESLVKKEADDKKLILANQLKTSDGKHVTLSNAKAFAKEVMVKKQPKVKTFVSKDGKKNVKYSVKINMVPNHLRVRAERFKDEVIRQSLKFNIDAKVSFAIMHTESHFNPKARSSVPAYGLMQLVPRSGARDAYLYIYGKDKLLRGSFLYVPKNNIELGCAYISKLRHVYFKNINDPESAYYCSISAYNTGPGNVAKALTGGTKLKSLVDVVNSRDSKWVYKQLRRKLPYKETRGYLAKVNKRMNYYENWN